MAVDAAKTLNWPDSTDFVKQLTYHHHHHEDHQDGVFTQHYMAPVFQNNAGPLCFVALILDGKSDDTAQHNPAAVPIVAACIEQFQAFEHALRQICKDKVLHVLPAEVPHLMIHSATSSSDDKPMKDDAADLKQQLLVKPLSNAISSVVKEPIVLTLNRLFLTPDGAMVAGFVPHNITTYRMLQQYAAVAIGGRTKNKQQQQQVVIDDGADGLVTVTVGHILGFGNEEQQLVMKHLPEQEAINQLVRRYNEEVLPATVAGMPQRSFSLQHVSLLRNTVWLCEENIIYKTWDLL